MVGLGCLVCWCSGLLIVNFVWVGVIQVLAMGLGCDAGWVLSDFMISGNGWCGLGLMRLAVGLVCRWLMGCLLCLLHGL